MTITLTPTTEAPEALEVPSAEAPSALLAPGEAEEFLRLYLWENRVSGLPDAQVGAWAEEFASQCEDPEIIALLCHADVSVQRMGVAVHMAHTQLDTYRALWAALKWQWERREALEREEAERRQVELRQEADRRQAELREQLAYNAPPPTEGRDLCGPVVKTVEVSVEVTAEEAETRRRAFRGFASRTGYWVRLSEVLAATDHKWVVSRLERPLQPSASPAAIQSVLSALKIAGGKLGRLKAADAKSKAQQSTRKGRPKGRTRLTQPAKAKKE